MDYFTRVCIDIRSAIEREIWKTVTTHLSEMEKRMSDQSATQSEEIRAEVAELKAAIGGLATRFTAWADALEAKIPKLPLSTPDEGDLSDIVTGLRADIDAINALAPAPAPETPAAAGDGPAAAVDSPQTPEAPPVSGQPASEA